MTDEIKPALSADEWRRKSAQRGTQYGMDGFSAAIDPVMGLTIDNRGSDDASSHDSAAHLAIIIALANAALPDTSSYKITRKDVYVMECAASAIRAEYGSGDEDALELDRLTAKLAALLPPER